MHQELKLSQYITILHGFHGAFSSLEKACESAYLQINHPNLTLEKRSFLAQEDIDYLSGPSLHESLPLQLPVPEIRTEAQVFGAVYVLEGSKLGGKVIGRHVNQVLGVTPQAGGRFFAGATEKNGLSWKEFLEVLAAFAEENPEKADGIIQSANATFGYIEDYFSAYWQKMRL